MIQIGGVYSTVCQEEGILLPKYRDRNGRCIAILFKSIGVRSRCDSPEFGWVSKRPNRYSKLLILSHYTVALHSVALGFPVLQISTSER